MQLNKNNDVCAAALRLRLGRRHGYRIEGDQAFISADILGLDGAGHEGLTLALELWALEAKPVASELRGIRVATLMQAGGLSSSLEGWAFAAPPAGAAPRAMALVLVDYSKPAPRVLDSATYERQERFSLPHLQGAGWRPVAGAVELWATQICNPRAAGDASGPLRLELWWLAKPYGGGAFDGRLLAGLELGALAGQSSRALAATRVANVETPAEPGYPVLMLREWTSGGYLTRDYAAPVGPALAVGAGGRMPAPRRAPLPAWPAGQTLAAAVALRLGSGGAWIVGQGLRTAPEESGLPMLAPA